MDNRKWTILIVVATFFGLLAGVTGALWSRSYLADGLLGLSRYGEIDLGNVTGPSFVIREPKNVVVEEDKQTIETIRSAPAALVGLYTAAAGKTDRIKRSSAIGQGLILTSDGWALFPSLDKEVAARLLEDAKSSTTRSRYFLAGSDGKQLALLDAKKDPVTAAVFVRAETKDWPVRRLAGPEEIETGQRLVVADLFGRGMGIRVVGDTGDLGPLSSERLSEPIETSPQAGKYFAGAFAFTLGGEAAASVDREGRVVPIGWYRSAADSLSRFRSVRHPSLGVYTEDIGELILTGGRTWPVKRGAVIAANGDTPAVAKGSAAEKAGLKAGDIITAVNNIEVGEGVDPAQVLSRHLPGDEVVIRYWRDGSAREARVTLAENRPK